MRVLRTYSRRFAENENGTFATIAAVAAVPLMFGVVAIANYSNVAMLERQAQAAADAAALAASTAYGSGQVTSTIGAQTIAAQFFAANASASIQEAQISFDATVTPPAPGASTVTTDVKYCGDVLPLFSNVLDQKNRVCVGASSSAAVVAAESGGGSYTGNGTSWGDPHIIGADGTNWDYSCRVGAWENVLSDYGLQINGLCSGWETNSNGVSTLQVLSDVAIVAGTHYIKILSGFTSPGNADFEGAVVVDGVTSAPTQAGTYTLLSDAAQKITLTDYYGQPGVPSSSANYIVLSTPEYLVSINFGDKGTATISAQARNAGACGLQGGVLGQSWGPVSGLDYNGLDFVVPGGSNLWYLGPQYSTTCATAASNTLTQQATLTK